MTTAREALARRRENGDKAHDSLADLIRDMQPQYQLAMPRGAEAAQLVRDALTAVRHIPKLAECEPTSVLGALMTCAQLGLRVGVLGQAWVLPFWDGKTRGHKAQLIIGYQGYQELAYRSGKVQTIAARTVYTNDHFELAYRPAVDMLHRPAYDGPRGEPRLYYAAAEMAGGGFALTDPMTVADMEAYRDRHASTRSRDGKIFGPWIEHPEAMAHKTMVRRLAKMLPKSTELAIAIQADGGVRVDLNPHVEAPDATSHPDMWEGEARPTSGPPAQDTPAAGSGWDDVAVAEPPKEQQ